MSKLSSPLFGGHGTYVDRGLDQEKLDPGIVDLKHDNSTAGPSFVHQLKLQGYRHLKLPDISIVPVLTSEVQSGEPSFADYRIKSA